MPSTADLLRIANAMLASGRDLVSFNMARRDDEHATATNLDELKVHGPSCANCYHKQSSMKTCNACQLVTYCSKECQKEHWKRHKPDCKKNRLASSEWKPKWYKENRLPAFGPETYKQLKMKTRPKFPWGDMRALDIGNLSQNEGASYDKSFNLCFAASGDLRNVIETVVGLPDSFTKTCSVVVNDNDTDVVTRNALMLLVIMYFPPEDAAIIATHLWYSAKLTVAIVARIQGVIGPKLVEVCKSIALDNKLDKTWTEEWKVDDLVLTMTLDKHVWFLFANLLRFNLKPEAADKARTKAWNDADICDERDLVYLTCTPSRRVSCQRFVDTGILAPFATDTSKFDIPNSTLLSRECDWHDTSGTLPLQGWRLPAVLASGRKAHLAVNDIYGALAIHVQNKLRDFCHALRKRPTHIELLNVDIRALPSEISDRTFDRVDVSNLVDPRWLVDLATLLYACDRLLKPRSENVHACVIGVFMCLIPYLPEPVRRGLLADSAVATSRAMATLNLTPWELEDMSLTDPTLWLCNAVTKCLGTFDDYIDTMLRDIGPGQEKHFGLEVKWNNTVVEEWPNRVQRRGPITMAQVEERGLSRLTGEERVVEWKRCVLPGCTTYAATKEPGPVCAKIYYSEFARELYG